MDRRPPAGSHDLRAAIPDLLFVFDREGTCLEFIAGRHNPLNLDPAQFVGKHLAEFSLSAQDVSQLHQAIQQALSSQTEQAYELTGPQGEGLVYEVRLSPLDEYQVLAIDRDMTERKLDQRRLEHRALHDPLTNLPNRALFMDLHPDHGRCRVGDAAIAFRLRTTPDGLVTLALRVRQRF